MPEYGVEEPAGLTMARLVVGWGWKVVPGFVAKSGDKIPVCGGDWVRKATLDVGQLKTWWSERPYLWPGTVSGFGSSLVLDADGPAAVDWVRSLAGNPGCWNSSGLVYRTPGRSGGLHCVWNFPSWMDRDFRQAKVVGSGGSEVQLRGNGHWTLLAGAKRGDGVYEVLQEPEGGVAGDPPRGLISAVLEQAVVASGGSYGGSGMEEVSEAEAWGYAPLVEGRKNLLAGVLWRVAIRGATEEEVIELGMRFSNEVCSPPLDEELVMKKAIYTYGRAQKRRAESRVQAENQLKRIMNRGTRFGEYIQ